jgi:hypothetical protein
VLAWVGADYYLRWEKSKWKGSAHTAASDGQQQQQFMVPFELIIPLVYHNFQRNPQQIFELESVGAGLALPARESAMKCPKCRTEVTEGAAFCWACEAPLGNLKPPPSSAPPPRASDERKLSDSTVGKNEEILGFAIFMIGVLWSCGATAGAQNPTATDYAWPILIMLAGLGLWIFGKVKGRRQQQE